MVFVFEVATMISCEGSPSLTPRYSHVIPGMSGNHELSTTWPSKLAESGAVAVAGAVPAPLPEPVGGAEGFWLEPPQAAADAARPSATESVRKGFMAPTVSRPNETAMRRR